MRKDFSALDDIDDDIEDAPSKRPQREAGASVFKTYGTLDKRAIETRTVKIKVPHSVIALIEAHSEPHTNRSLVYTQMLELAAEEYRKQLLLGDVEIKY